MMRYDLLVRTTAGLILAGALCLGGETRAAAEDATAKSSKSSTPQKTANKRTTSSARKGTGAKTAKASSTSRHSRSKKGKKRGQQAIDAERARQIQQALIQQHYMDGEPSGHWDAATEAALRKFQGAQGWQTKTVPDSRALIKLGLGPSKDGLLNPESAMTTVPASVPKSDPPATTTSAGKPQP